MPRKEGEGSAGHTSQVRFRTRCRVCHRVMSHLIRLVCKWTGHADGAVRRPPQQLFLFRLRGNRQSQYRRKNKRSYLSQRQAALQNGTVICCSKVCCRRDSIETSCITSYIRSKDKLIAGRDLSTVVFTGVRFTGKKQGGILQLTGDHVKLANCMLEMVYLRGRTSRCSGGRVSLIRTLR